MKKGLLIFAAIFTIGFAANAQDGKPSKEGASKAMVKFGPKAGLNIATVSENNASSMVGFHVGGFAEIMISDKFAVQPEALYSAQGAKFSGADLHLDYILVPVMAKYFVLEGFSVEAGPQIGFLTSAKIKADGGGTTDVKNLANSTDFAVNVGLGYSLPMGIMFSGRYNIGVTDTAKNNSGSASRNGVFQLSVGYKF